VRDSRGHHDQGAVAPNRTTDYALSLPWRCPARTAASEDTQLDKMRAKVLPSSVNMMEKQGGSRIIYKVRYRWCAMRWLRICGD